ncbi:MAG: tyrosine-type recombinase/integrase [Coriobacteriales bacterium]
MLGSIPKRVNTILSMLAELAGQYGIAGPAEVAESHVLVSLTQLSRKGRAASTIAGHLAKVREFFRYLIQEGRLDADPTANIRVGQGVGYSNATREIPEDILVFIEDHIDEMRPRECRLIFKVAMETGWRISDIRNIRVEDIGKEPTADGLAVIRTRSSKTAAARVKKQLGDKIFAVVSGELYREILDYVDETAAQREMYSIDTLFFSISNGAKTEFPASKLNKSVNDLLDKYGIKSVCEDYDNFTSRQTRKTVAVELITSGAAPAAVQKQLGHTNQSTTERIYAQVRGKKLAELNNEFYQEKFNLMFVDLVRPTKNMPVRKRRLCFASIGNASLRAEVKRWVLSRLVQGQEPPSLKQIITSSIRPFAELVPDGCRSFAEVSGQVVLAFHAYLFSGEQSSSLKTRLQHWYRVEAFLKEAGFSRPYEDMKKLVVEKYPDRERKEEKYIPDAVAQPEDRGEGLQNLRLRYHAEDTRELRQVLLPPLRIPEDSR